MISIECSKSAKSLLVLAALLLSGAAHADLEAARAKWSEYEQKRAAASEAAATGDNQRASQLATEASAALDAGILEFQSARTSESNDESALRDYARALFEREDYDLATAVLQRAVTISPESAELYLNLARTQLAWGRVPEAEKSAKTALDFSPPAKVVGDANALLGRIYSEMKLHEFARERFEKSLAAQPDNIISRMGLAAVKVREGQMAEASAALDELGALPQVQSTIQQELLAEALEAFEQSRRAFPDDAANHLAYAKLLLRGQRVDDALFAVERAVKLNPDDYVAWNLLGSISRVMNSLDRAEEAFRRSIELNPDQPRTLEALQELQRLQQQPAPVTQ